MKRSLLSCFFIFSSLITYAQREVYRYTNDVRKGQEVVCPASYNQVHTRVEMSPEVLKRLKQGRSAAAPKAQIIVDYVDFPADAKNAFQRAIDIWSSLLSSDVPIRVVAYWQSLGKNVLGSATATDFRRNFPGVNKAFTWYSMPLAEKISGQDINSINDYDILCRFSSDSPWNYLEGGPKAGEFDLTSVVLHELCHGLGFAGSMDVIETTGQWGYGSTSPFIFDTFGVNGEGVSLTDTSKIKNNSVELKNQLTSTHVFFNGPLAIKNNAGQLPKLFAPSRWQDGSSFSHLDDKTYPPGNPNSLMTSTADLGEVVLDPGPITLGIMADLGWKRTAIVHTPLKDTKSVADVVVRANILSDTTLKPNTAVLIYSTTKFADSTTVPLRLVSGNTYEGIIKNGGKATSYQYYLRVEDNYGKTVTSPPQAPRYIWAVSTGAVDTGAPTMQHLPADIVSSNTVLPVTAIVEDDFAEGIDSVYISYTLNGNARPTVKLRLYNRDTDPKSFSQGAADSDLYLTTNAFGTLKDGDRVRYQIIAVDKAGNKSTLPMQYRGASVDDLPVPAFHEVVATSLLPAKASFSTDFNAGSVPEFEKIGFTIGTTSDFTTPLLHNDGYENGKGFVNLKTNDVLQAFEFDHIALLRHPIILTADKANATITFDEVVLVEPGDKGSVYGDNNFYDFVIVEASPNGGQSWIPVADGYDSNKEATWLSKFNSGFANNKSNTSRASGTQSLAKPRTLELFGGKLSDLPSGLPLLIRFRLHADQFINGWGWGIDNLRIQEAKPVILGTTDEPTSDTSIMPNPASESVQLRIQVKTPQTVTCKIWSTRGGLLLTKQMEVKPDVTYYPLDVRTVAEGSHILSIYTQEGVKSKRLTIARN